MIKQALAFSGVLASFALAAPAQAQSSGASFSGTGGKAVYENICQACHMPGGAGAVEGFPALAKNKNLAQPAYPILVVLNGKGHMPALGRMFTDQQVSDVVNYVRSSFNAYKPTTTPAEVAALRGAQ